MSIKLIRWLSNPEYSGFLFRKDMIDYKKLDQYIKKNLISETYDFFGVRPHGARPHVNYRKSEIAYESCYDAEEISDELIIDLDESFSETVLKLIDEKGLKDTDVYNSINMDRRLFSKMRSSDYSPSKQTAIALCVALKLNLEETNGLLRKAGYTLSHSNKADVIIEYFIKNQIYDLYTIDEALLHYDQKPLGRY